MPEMTSQTDLYRHYDADGRLLYVGISLNHVARLGQHKVNSEWFRSIKTVTIESFGSRDEARQAEARAIRDELPLHTTSLACAASRMGAGSF